MKRIEARIETEATRPHDAGGAAGNIIIPFIFILSLLSLVSMGVLQVGGTGNTTSEALSERSQARLAALSGIELAYSRLSTDRQYTGEQCTPFAAPGTSVDVAVTALGDDEFEVVSHGTSGMAEAAVRTRAAARPFFLEYPLSVGNNIILKGTSKILGECYIKNILWGKEESEITGSVFMMGPREVLYDLEGKPATMDGYPCPIVGGAVFCDAPVIEFPGLILDGLREIAAASGQIYTGTKHFNDKVLEGVLYFEGESCHPYFKDVCVKGVLVFDGVPEIRIEHGFFKIHCDDDVLENVALLAPQATLWVDPNAHIDVYGLTLFNAADFQGRGTFTGPMVVLSDLTTLPDSYLYCQFPSQMRDNIDKDLIWSELHMVELEYEEL